jgi:hypothetical protein
MSTNEPNSEHIWFDEHAAAYLMDGLEQSDRARIESHAADCATCAAKLATIKETDQTMNTLFASMRPTANFEQAIIAGLHRPMRLIPAQVNPLVRRAAIAAAAAIVLGGLGYVANEKINNDRWPTADLRFALAPSAPMNASTQPVAALDAVDQLAVVTASSAHQMSIRRLAPTDAPAGGFGGGGAGGAGGTGFGVDERANRDDVNGGSQYAATLRFDRKADKASPSAEGEKMYQARLEENKAGIAGENTYAGGTVVTNGTLKLGFSPATGLPTAPQASYFQPDGTNSVGGLLTINGSSTVSQHGQRSSENRRSPAAMDKDRLALADDQNAPVAMASPVAAPVAAVPDVGATDGPDEANKKLPEPPTAPTTPPAPPPATPDQPAPPQPIQRKVIRNGTMDFTVDSFDSAYLQISAIVSEEGGYVATTNSQQMPNGKVTGTVTVRVAPDHLDVLVLKLRALGELKGQKITAEDVTQQYTDLASELRAARAMEDRLLDLIKNGKGSIKDLLSAEKELGDWREKIEKITGQMNYFDNLVSLSTLELTLTEKDIKNPALASQTETVDMGVETEDVEKARTDAISTIDEAKGRIVETELKQFDAGQLAGKIVADVPPDKAGPVIDHLKQLGKVSRLEVQRQEITTDGHGQPVNADTLPPGLRVEQKDTRLTVSLYNLANVAPRQTANVELACDDVEPSYHAILDRVAKAGGRVLSSNLSRPTPDQVTGSLSFEVKSTDADGVLMDVKQAGEVMQSNVIENPDTENVTSTKRGFSVQLRPLASVNPREVSNLNIAAPDVVDAYNKLLAAVQKLNARIILSRLDNEDDPNLHETAGYLDFEIKRTDLDAAQQALNDAGEMIQRQVMRSSDDQNTLDTKMQFKVALHNARLLDPRENWTLAIESGDVDSAQADVLSGVTAAGGRIVDSTLSKESNGKMTANITVDVPLDQSAVLVDRVKHEGDVRVVQSTKNPQAPDGKLARSRLAITISSPESIVSADHGIWASIRTGLSTSISALLWSLQLIIIGLCVVGPFVAAIWAAWRVAKWKNAKP